MAGTVKIELPLELAYELGALALYETEPVDSIIARIAISSLNIERARQRKGWSNTGVFLAEGTKLKFVYNKDEYRGEVIGVDFVFGNVRSDMPSKVVMDAVEERTGHSVNLNGWNYLAAELNGEWVPLRDLRARAQSQENKLRSEI